jgi:hypothetical protein
MYFDPRELALTIPIVAIVGGLMIQAIKMLIEHREHLASIKAANQAANGDVSSSDIQQLRDEIARLRDTTTQYDLSIDHHLQDLDQRLSSLENHRLTYTAPIETEPERQLNRPNS